MNEKQITEGGRCKVTEPTEGSVPVSAAEPKTFKGLLDDNGISNDIENDEFILRSARQITRLDRDIQDKVIAALHRNIILETHVNGGIPDDCQCRIDYTLIDNVTMIICKSHQNDYCVRLPDE